MGVAGCGGVVQRESICFASRGAKGSIPSFDRVMAIGGRKPPYFSRIEGEVNHARMIGDTGIYASCQGSGDIISRRAERVVQEFGYSPSLLSIEIR